MIYSVVTAPKRLPTTRRKWGEDSSFLSSMLWPLPSSYLIIPNALSQLFASAERLMQQTALICSVFSATDRARLISFTVCQCFASRSGYISKRVVLKHGDTKTAHPSRGHVHLIKKQLKVKVWLYNHSAPMLATRRLVITSAIRWVEG